jgi:hypothetical protein
MSPNMTSMKKIEGKTDLSLKAFQESRIEI